MTTNPLGILLNSVVIFSLTIIYIYILVKHTLNSSNRTLNSQPLSEQQRLKLNDLFIESEEQYRTSIGNGYILNFLSNQNIFKGFAVVSNCRVYFKGTFYTIQQNKFMKLFESKTVDLKDITGTGFRRRELKYLLYISYVSFAVHIVALMLALTESIENEIVTLALFLGSIILAIALLVIYNLKRLDLFEISYAGGVIAFKTIDYSLKEIEEFQKQLRIAKNEFEKQDVKLVSEISSKNGTDIVAQLEKLHSMLKNGIITEEEFAQYKKELVLK